MSIPTPQNIGYYLGSNGNPINDTDPYGGPINTTTLPNQSTPGNLFKTVSIRESSYDRYSHHIRRGDFDSGTLQNARFYDRAGCILNTSAGSVALSSTSASDTGQSVRVIGKTAGAWFTETIVLGSVGQPVLGSRVFDSNTVYRWEYVSGIPHGTISCFVNSQLVGMIRGTEANSQDTNALDESVWMISAEVQWALASAKNNDITGPNRLTAPSSGIGSFASATSWPSQDSSINIPSGVLNPEDSIAVIGKWTIQGGIPQPINSFGFCIHPTILGDSQA